MKLDEQKALTSKKAKRLLQNNNKTNGSQNGTTEFKTLSQHIKGRRSVDMGLEDEESQEEEPRGPY